MQSPPKLRRMIEGGTFARCPYCDRVVDMSASDVVYAVKHVDAQGSGPVHDVVESAGAFFHPSCPPERVGYVRRPRPDD
jgi:hypothetical protein